MSIRTKKTKHCSLITTSVSGVGETYEDCWDEIVPIREWSLSPETISLTWSEKDPIPSTQLISIVFPDIEELTEYKYVRYFKYAVVVEDVPWCKLESNLNLKDISLPSDGLVRVHLKYNNFHQLNPGNNSVSIKVLCIGANPQVEQVLEARTINVNVVRNAASGGMVINTNKSEYHVTYNKLTDKVSGDLDVRLNFKNFDADLLQYTATDINKTGKSDIRLLWDRIDKDLIHLHGIRNKSVPDKEYRIECVAGAYDIRVPNNPDPICVSPAFTVIVKVISGVTTFHLSQNNFNFSLRKSQNEKARGQFTINKNPNANIVISPSPGLDITQENISDSKIVVKFSSKNAQDLKKGENKAGITVSCTLPDGSEEYSFVSINIIVEEDIDYRIKDVIFCLDKNPMTINQSTPAAVFMRSVFNMKYTGYDGNTTTIEQKYEHVFFNGRIIIYPGEEIQDFFNNINNLEDFSINESDLVAAKPLFKAAVVSIFIEEYDSEGNTYKHYKLDNLHYMPGKKPKAFPFLTNSTVRSTYSNSLVSVSAMAMDMKGKSLSLIGSHLADNSALTNDYEIANVSFRRSVADKSYGAKKIITRETLSLEPKRNVYGTIDAVFQNQNFCPEWFSFSEEYEENKELEQILSENAASGGEFKALVKNKSYLILNTGWIFREEITVLEELIMSKVCFVKLNGRWIKTIPVDKKTLDYNSERNLNSMLVKFKIVDNER